MKNTLLGLGVVLLLTLSFLQTRFSKTFDPGSTAFPTHAIAAGKVWKLEIAHTDELRALGLGERDGLPKNKGMLFLFDSPRAYGFWMKGMRFPIDIVFIFRGEVVFIERGIQPDDPKIVIPPRPVDQVLELNAGQGSELSIGDQVWYWRSF